LPFGMEDLRDESRYQPIPIDQVGYDFLPDITLEEWQYEGIRKAYNAEVGIYDVPTGGGKTEIMAGICKAMRCPTAIIAEQTVITEQIKKRLELRKVVEEVGMFYAGKMPGNQLVLVGTVQSLVVPSKPPKPPIIPDKLPSDNAAAIMKAVKNKEEYEFDKDGRKHSWLGKIERKYYDKVKRHLASLKGYRTRKKRAKVLRSILKKCHMLIVDECDLATNKMYANVFRHWFAGRRRYGFTGTPYDETKPVERLILNENLGSVIHKTSRKKVEGAERIIPFEYYMIAYGEEGNKQDARMFDIATNDFIVHSRGFHNAVANLINLIQEQDKDDGTLILVERDDLGYALKAKIPNSEYFHGKTPKKRRPEILKSFEQRSINVLIGGKNVRRGLDLDGGCENLIIATGGKLGSEFEQKIGRSVRRNRKGKARVWDWLFLCNKYLYDHSRKRLKHVVKMKYPSHVIFSDGMINGEQFVKSRFRKSKRYLTESII
jgi:superfamily II DNA or RNA helicase